MILIDPQDLLICFATLIAGLLIIDPFGISSELFEMILWLLPALITFECLSASPVESPEISGNAESIRISQQGYQTARWIDFWICDTGLQVGVSVVSYLQLMPGTVSDVVIPSGASPIALTLRIALLGWWIVDVQAERSVSAKHSTGAAHGADILPADVTVLLSKAQEDPPERPLSSGVSPSAAKPVCQLDGAVNMEGSISHSNREAQTSELPSTEERRKATATNGKEEPVKRAQWKRDVDDSLAEYSSSSASSYSSSGSLSDDEESMYSHSSSASRQMPISVQVTPKAFQSQVPSPFEVTPLSDKSNTEKLLFTRETPASAMVGLDCAPQHRSSSGTITRMATDDDSPPCPDRGTAPVNPVVLRPAPNNPEPPQRASEIIAQLDSLLFDELDKLAMLSPADTEVNDSATSMHPSTSPLTSQLAALESKRAMEVVRKDRARQIGRGQASNPGHPSPSDKVSSGPNNHACRKRLTGSALLHTNQTEKRNTVSLQLDDLLATRMSDLFPSSVKSSTHPVLLPGGRSRAPIKNENLAQNRQASDTSLDRK
ncbi:hypothetical protein QFC22_004799 [Naganishia vaughanmartiniae]|uniref:Uncharacterized protein n=1 Tax=Naganishia vaughanmartiniae TaxID=1424756 RepID=A0ACC2WY13_9TREE|nr:hypothetical protein QFC22_004799 [Naganishia vaughanmartiniae]